VKAEALHVNSEQQSTLRCMEIEKKIQYGQAPSWLQCLLHNYNDS